MASSATRKRLRVDRDLSKCESRKLGLKSKRDAIDHAESLMEKGFVNAGCHLTPYKCEICGDWHIFNRKIRFPERE